jgi:predicted PurR-regulated permease PerM
VRRGRTYDGVARKFVIPDRKWRCRPDHGYKCNRRPVYRTRFAYPASVGRDPQFYPVSAGTPVEQLGGSAGARGDVRDDRLDRGCAGQNYVGGPPSCQLLEEVPRHETNLREKARHVHSLLGGTGIWQRAIDTLRNVEQEVNDPETESKPLKIEVASDRPLSIFLEYTRSAVPSIATAGLSLVMTIFMLLQYGELRDRVVRLMGVAEIGRSIQTLNEASYDLAHFLLLQTALNVSFGVFIATALWLIGIPSPGLWGAAAAVMRYAPYVGSVLAGIFPIALAAMVDPGWWKLMETTAVFVGGDIMVGQFVEPLLFGSRTRLSSIAVVFGAAFWTLLWGPIGLILAVPLTLTVVVIGQHIPHLEFLRVLLGNESVREPHQKLYRQLLAEETAEDLHWPRD